jgi:hypothetical protein
MDPITLVVLLAVAGGAYFGRHQIAALLGPAQPAPAPAPAPAPGVQVFPDPTCQAQFAALPAASQQQILNAMNQARQQGGQVGAATLASAASIVKPAAPQLANCLNALATQMSGGAAPAVYTPGPAAALLSGQCLQTYQNLDPATRAAVDAAVAQAQSAGGGATGAQLLQAYASSVAAANPALSQCLAAASTTMGGGTATGPGAAIFVGPCLQIYQGLDPVTRAAVDSAINQANLAGGGAAGAAILNQYAAVVQTANPAFSSCVTAAATTMAAQVGGGQTGSTGGASGINASAPSTGSGSGATFFSDSCLTTYNALDGATKGSVDAAIDHAQVSGGAAGAMVLATEAQKYIATNPDLYGCLLASATTMNGGTMPDLTSLGTPNNGAQGGVATQMFRAFAPYRVRAHGTISSLRAPF